MNPKLLALAALALPAGFAPQARAEGPATPRLFVLVVVDQLRGDYLDRWDEHFGEGGFRRMRQGGASFRECHFPYAGTWTAAGHASVAAGCSPDTHGLIANEWYDREQGRQVYCVASERHERVPPDPKGGGSMAPDTLLADTFADALKRATGGKSKVVALSFKDRASVLPGGKRPDACYWFDDATGTFVTSNYYRAAPHPWVREFNESRPADAWFGKEWDRYRPELDYVGLAGPDEPLGGGTGVKQGRSFPLPLTGGLDRPGRDFYKALYNSPAGNDLLMSLVKEAVVAEQLGADEVPDLLAISFSSNDAVGHAWGPDSQQVFDITLRTDTTMKELLDYLDEKVGRGRYMVALTADHGVCPTPEAAREQGHEAGRIDTDALFERAEAYLDDAFGAADKGDVKWIEQNSNEWIYLNLTLLERLGLDRAKVERELADWLAKQPGLAAAFTRADLTEPGPDADPILKRAARSFHPARAGDVALVVAPYHLLGTTYTTGTTHGSPHRYDTHVPLLIYGPGVEPGERDGEVSPTCIPAAFSAAAGIDPPADADTPAPAGLFRGR